MRRTITQKGWKPISDSVTPACSAASSNSAEEAEIGKREEDEVEEEGVEGKAEEEEATGGLKIRYLNRMIKKASKVMTTKVSIGMKKKAQSWVSVMKQRGKTPPSPL